MCIFVHISALHAIQHTYTRSNKSDDMWCRQTLFCVVLIWCVCMNNVKHWALNFITRWMWIYIICIFNIRSFVTKAKAIFFGFFSAAFAVCLFACLLACFFLFYSKFFIDTHTQIHAKTIIIDRSLSLYVCVCLLIFFIRNENYSFSQCYLLALRKWFVYSKSFMECMECMISNRNGFIRKVGAHDENILNERKRRQKKRNNELTN